MPINLKQARLTLGLNQTEMSKAMGVARSTWLHWEREERQMNGAAVRLLQVLLWLQSEGVLSSYLDWINQ